MMFRIGIQFDEKMVCRLDYELDATHGNDLGSGMAELMIQGPHWHAWELNRHSVSSVLHHDRLRNAVRYTAARRFDAALRWYCGERHISLGHHGIELPRRLQIEFSKVVQAIADGEGVELSAERLWRSFEDEYLEGNGRFGFIEHTAASDHGDQNLTARISDDGKHKTIHGHGNGPVDGFVDAMRKESGLAFDVADYREHAMGTGAKATAIAYAELRLPDGGTLFGVGIDKNIVVASLKAVLSGVNRVLKRQ
jgi:hypothetical protein